MMSFIRVHNISLLINLIACLQAESWLRSQAQAHGWEKATKLQGRATAQGLVSILSSQHNAVMMEVNCETDFVARNKKFQSLVQKLTNSCYTFSKGQTGAGDTILSKVKRQIF